MILIFILIVAAEDSQTGTIVRKNHKKNGDVPEDIVEVKAVPQPTPQPIIVSEPDPVFSNGNSSALEEDDEDGDLGLKARALYDYQAGELTYNSQYIFIDI